MVKIIFLTTYRFVGAHSLPKSIKRRRHNLGELKDVCWICEGWRPFEVRWNPESSGTGEQDPIHIHFSYEGNKPRFLPKNKNFKMIRMAPTTEFTYLFSVDDFQTYAFDQPSKPFKEMNMKVIFIFEFLL